MFPGWREAFLFIDQSATNNSVIVQSPPSGVEYAGFKYTQIYDYYDMRYQGRWYTKYKVRTTNKYYEVNEMLTVPYWDKCFYVFSAIAGFDTDLKNFQNKNPDLRPVKIIKELGGKEALYIFMVSRT